MLCAVNSLFHYPMLLLLFGASPELVPLQHVNRISTPSPQLKSVNKQNKAITLNGKRPQCRKKSHHCHVKNTNLNNEPSLTTITEEPSWQSSASSISNVTYRDGNISDSSNASYKSRNFAIPPRVHHNNLSGSTPKSKTTENGTSSNINIDPSTQPAFKSIIVQPEVTVETHHNGNHQNTKVTATANIKLEFTTHGPTATATTTESMS